MTKKKSVWFDFLKSIGCLKKGDFKPIPKMTPALKAQYNEFKRKNGYSSSPSSKSMKKTKSKTRR